MLKEVGSKLLDDRIATLRLPNKDGSGYQVIDVGGSKPDGPIRAAATGKQKRPTTRARLAGQKDPGAGRLCPNPPGENHG